MIEELKQKAEDSLSKRMGTIGYSKRDNVDKPYTDGYIAGYEANAIRWRKVSDGDLPPDRHNVLSEKGDVVFLKDMRWYEYSPNYDNIILKSWEEPKHWCEIPTFEE